MSSNSGFVLFIMFMRLAAISGQVRRSLFRGRRSYRV